MANIYQNPPPGLEPYISGNFVWIKIEARSVHAETAFVGNNEGGLITGPVVWTWKFLAPPSIPYTLNHSWEPWETIASRLSGIGKQYGDLLTQGKGMVSAITASTGMDIQKRFLALQSGTQKNKMKVDTPLVYENSERIEYNLEFHLISKDNIRGYLDVVAPIKRLEYYSSPDRTTEWGGLGIDLPYVFSLKSEITNPDGDDSIPPFLEVKTAALTSIQPTFKEPYDKNGYPMACDLVLTFKNLEPIYRDDEYDVDPSWSDLP